MDRVVILGRGGAGKSTAARRLGEITGLPVIELDKHFWQPGLQPLPREKWAQVQHNLVDQPRWIIDGDLGKYDLLPIRLRAADAVLVLDFPLLFCLWRAFRRSKENLEFWLWMLTWGWVERPKIRRALKRYALGADVRVLHRPAELDAFIRELPRVPPDQVVDTQKLASPFRSEEERTVTLSSREREGVLNADPRFRSIERATYFDNYDLPCPIRVEVRTDDGLATVVLRKTRHGDVANETAMFRALHGFGLPVPDVLSEPFDTEDGQRAAVYSLLPGDNLQKLSVSSPENLDLAKDLLIEAVGKLTSATDFIRESEVGASLESRPLSQELADVRSDDNPWLREARYASAVSYLEDILPSVTTSLVLSNGDYQPGNFLAEDGKLTGFLDFESPCFQDPLMGFVKYPIYDLYPLSRTDLVETFLRQTGFSKKDFDVRLALGCSKILKTEIPLNGGDEETQRYRERVLTLLSHATVMPGVQTTR